MSRIPATILITGTRRGIGLGLVKQWAKYDEVQNIFACSRRLEDEADLSKLIEKDPRIRFIKMDVNSDFDIVEARNQVERSLGPKTGLNLLINNAAINFSGGSSLFGADRKVYSQHFETNVISSVKVVEEFYPLIRKAANAVSTTELGVYKAAVLNISSILGSVAMNRDGTKRVKNIAYRLSKAALNQLTKTLAVDFVKDGILVVSIHPGWVRTDMGGPHAPVQVDESVSQIVETSIKLQKLHNGKFLSSTGKDYSF